MFKDLRSMLSKAKTFYSTVNRDFNLNLQWENSLKKQTVFGTF